jgi:hypothetical protein
MLIEYHLSHLN